jgi:hypothetical protein
MEKLDQLDFNVLKRIASNAPGSTREGRVSIDFTVNGASLLRMLAKGGADLMGCFVQGYPDSNDAVRRSLLEARSADSAEGRTLLYVCPECGDIGCGAYAAKIQVMDGRVTWSEFAFVNGYEPASPLPDVGSFQFDQSHYATAIERASQI